MCGTQKMRKEGHNYPFITAETHRKTSNKGEEESIGTHTCYLLPLNLIIPLTAIWQLDKSIQGEQKQHQRIMI